MKKTPEIEVTNNIQLSVVIPVYNESNNIEFIHNRLSESLSSFSGKLELIFINDGSKDNSIELIQALATKYDYVKYIDFSRNFGHQIAVTAGLEHASGDAIAIIDADLQDPPELIPEMYQKLKEDFDVVYAKRNRRKNESLFKLLTAKLFYRILSNITSVEIPVDTGDFRVVSKRAVDIIKEMPEQNKFLRGQFAWIGFNQTYVSYDRDARHSGETGYPFKKMLRFALDGITSFSDFPLKFATYSGFIVSAISFVVIMYSLYARFIIKDYVPGWASIMISILFIGGIQLISLGIIGEYIGRIAGNVRKRPLYIVKEKKF